LSAIDAPLLSTLKGVGPALTAKLARLNLFTLVDLLFHLPLRYQDRSHIKPLAQLRLGDEALIEVQVVHSEVVHRRRAMLLCRVKDDSGELLLRFFHFAPGQVKQLYSGQSLRCFGEVKLSGGQLEMVHPEYRVQSSQNGSLESAFTPLYPATEGLSQAALRRLMQQALCWLQQEGVSQLPDYLPPTLLDSLSLPTLQQALLFLHQPPAESDPRVLMLPELPARRRLVIEELLAHHLSLTAFRVVAQQQQAPVLKSEGKLLAAFLDSLSFSLTLAQQRVIAELRDDLNLSQPMLRLLQGDVGSGKTVVAVAAALLAIELGYQVALMAPTELLAEQHAKNCSDWLLPLGLKVAFVGGRLGVKARREVQQQIASGEVSLVVGTHALFQESVQFSRLALTIVDEQHRFGVHQRLALREKGLHNGLAPHQLIMTATPIPRTLAMTAYADLDCSIIDELPPGRTAIKTVAISDQRRDEVMARVAQACLQGRQVYWVCTLIEESELLQCQAAESIAEYLREALLGCRIGLIHGRMKAKEKTALMAQFKAAKLDLLVATTVIEVGVDVPNASLMIIENAERLGLSQLHQLRGRVGRGSVASSCLLLYQAPLSQSARARLAVMRASNDGFEIAEEDLRLRGPGELLGTRQTGLVEFVIADLQRDALLLPEIKQWAERMRAEFPQWVEPLVQRWIRGAERYGSV